MQIPEEYVRAGGIAREMKAWVKSKVRPGIGYLEICDAIEKEVERRGGKPAFPCAIGVNHVTAHYAPQEEDAAVIREEDLVKLDYGVHVDGWIADTSVSLTFNSAYQPLLQATERALQAAISVAKRDRRIGEIGRAVAAEASRSGFRPISNLSGHTLERYTVHAGKSIPSTYLPNLPVLKKEEVFAIEPFLTFSDAAGYVVDAPQTTIYALMARKRTGQGELDSLVERIWNERKTLPFSPRWFLDGYGRERLSRLLDELERRRILRGYPSLVEASGKPVAQFEHTLALGQDGLMVLT